MRYCSSFGSRVFLISRNLFIRTFVNVSRTSSTFKTIGFSTMGLAFVLLTAPLVAVQSLVKTGLAVFNETVTNKNKDFIRTSMAFFYYNLQRPNFETQTLFQRNCSFITRASVLLGTVSMRCKQSNKKEERTTFKFVRCNNYIPSVKSNAILATLAIVISYDFVTDFNNCFCLLICAIFLLQFRFYYII